MAENNQLSDETKNNSTDTSSTDASSAVIGNHENAVVPHKISNHDKLVQTMVMVDGEWINVNDTNDQANMKEDVHKVNKKVVEAQKGIVEAKNAADSAVKYADSAISASKVNSDAIVAQSEAISEAKSTMDSAAASIRADVATVQSEVNTAKTANETEVKSIRDDLKMANSSIATVKDHLGNVSSELDTYAKSAATQGHDITIIQQKQGQFEVDYAGTKGDVNQIKANIKGLSENLKNSEGDVASLQVTAKKLQSSMSDAEGNISNLQVTAKSYDKIFEDHLGRISKVEQTASELTNEFSDQQGHLNRVEQTAQATQQTVANQQGQINNIKTDAAGMHQTITGQGNQIANINVTLGGLSTKYEDVSGDLSKLKDSNQWKIVTGAFDANQYTQTARIFYQDTQAKNTPDSGWFYLMVEAPETNRITQNLIKDNSNDSWSRFYSGEWSSWTRGITQLDIDSLSNKITTNSTAIDQTNKHISLKADQTEVDKIKNTASQNSSRLDVMANEIKSKVASTDVNNIVDGKGYATISTVQSLITQKAGTINESITNLTNKVNSNNGGGVNLLQGTAKIEFPLNNNGGTQTIQKYDDETNYIQCTSNTPIYDMGPWWPWTPEIGQVYTMSADVCGNGYIQGGEFHYEGGDEGNLGRVDLTNDWHRISNTFRVNTISGNWVIYANNSTLLKVKHIKIERGSVATPWTPAPSDNASVSQLQSVTASIDGLQSAVKNKVDQSQYTQLAGVVQTKVSQSDFNRLNNQVNVQTLDNANIDNMKTTGHYFVHNLTGNPLGGWVYVDVTGNGNDRIRQDVYQDIGTKHAFRRWFNTFWTGWSTGAEESEITQLRSDINLRVKSGDLLSQINIAAGHTLIQSNKIYFDADSFVMSPNSTAFIPSAYITDINADKINTGTLHSITINNGNGTFRVDPDGNVYANSMHVNNGSIYQGTVLGADVYSISNLTSNSLDEVNDATQNWVKLKDGIIELHGANGNHYSSIVPIDVTTTYGGDGGSTDVHHGLGILDSREVIIGSASLDFDDNNRITHSRNFSVISRTQLGITNNYIQAQLDPDVEYGKGARFLIQKDNKVGVYVGDGDNGNQVNVQFAGDGSGFNIRGNFNVYGAKNSAVKTSQGDVAVSAYETAEYYFGDIGEGQTDSNGVAYIGIEKLFNETVNTNIPYQVFITAYGPGNVWVEQRKQDRFMVKSSQPNIKFGWEIKAKRRGYENTRLQKVN